MERIITLMKEKNHYLEKFYTMNENELLNFGDGNFDNLESFYRARDKILDLIRTLDSIIDEESTKTALPVPLVDREEIGLILREKDEWVTSILSQDLQVLSWVEKEKSNIIRELQSIRKGKKVVQGYHSGSRQRTVVDEKA